MRHNTLLALIAIACVALGGCVETRAPKAPVVGPAPHPVAVSEAEALPISIVQDATVLPPSQPVPPEALPPLDPPEPITPRIVPAETGEAARKRSVTAARKPPEIAPAPAAPVQAPPTQPAGALIATGSNLPGREALAAKINEVKSTAARIPNTSMSNSQRLTYKRVESFIKLAEHALARGDLRQAGELADRAATLARALTP